LLLKASILHLKAYDVNPFFEIRHIEDQFTLDSILAEAYPAHEIIQADTGFPAKLNKYEIR